MTRAQPFRIRRAQAADLPQLVQMMAAFNREEGIATFGHDLEYAGRDSFLTELFVRPARRGAGEGRRLLLAITEQMRKDGAVAMHLAVRPTNRRAWRLYHSSGFDRLPRIVLTKRLARGKSSAISL